MSAGLEFVTGDGDDAVHHRCAEWARGIDLDPAGTAPQADVFVLVEHPLPWPRDVADDPLLAEVQRAASDAAPGRRVRLQAVLAATGATRTVVVLTATRGPFLGYGRVEGAAAPADLPGLAAHLVAQEPAPPSPGVTDVLICTHGARDACCGALGTRLWQQAGGASARVWRTSHTGGHRFAPTAVTFPDGNYWAFLDAELLAGIVERTLDPATAAAHLRGCAAFAPVLQVADRAGLGARGWEWLACARFGDARSESRVELCFESPDGARGGFDVCVGDGRRLPVPECGRDPATATKSQVERTVVRVRSWA